MIITASSADANDNEISSRVLQQQKQQQQQNQHATNCHIENKATLIISYPSNKNDGYNDNNNDDMHHDINTKKNETDYTLYLLDTSSSSSGSSSIISQGYIERDKSVGICIDLSSSSFEERCIILSKNKASSTSISSTNIQYYVIDESNYIINQGLLEEKYVSLYGACASNNTCDSKDDNMIIIWNNHNDNGSNYTYTLIEDDMIASRGMVPTYHTKTLCITSKTCNSNALDVISGKATYFIFEKNQIIDIGLSNDYYYIDTSSCSHNKNDICDTSHPILSSTIRGRRIITMLSTISGMQVLANSSTPQYKTACWLIYDDIRQLLSSSSDDDGGDDDDTTISALIQRYILGILYYSTEGSTNWKNQMGFISGKSECEWDGIVCTSRDGISGMVNEVCLSDNNLIGNLIPEFYSLMRLEKLNLKSNKLSGSIPEGIIRLKLKYINLSNNNLSDNIPIDIFLISTIEELFLYNNKFTGTIPNLDDDIDNMEEEAQNDDYDVKKDNQIQENLSIFNVHDNELTGTIPIWLMNSTKLVYFNIQRNMIHGTIPNTIMNLKELQYLWVGMNYLTGTLPFNIFMSLKNLVEFNAHYNLLTGSIPTTTIDDTFSSSLKQLWLSYNAFSGAIPSSLSYFDNIQQLFLSHNSLTGTFPIELQSLTNLYDLQIEYNDIIGTIPYYDCKQFQTLSSNCAIPKDISECKCCTRCYGLFTTSYQKDKVECSSSVLKIKINDDQDTAGSNGINFYIENTQQQLILESNYLFVKDSSLQSCISPTDCFVLRSSATSSNNDSENDDSSDISNIPFDVIVDDQIIYKNVTIPSTTSMELKFGYHHSAQSMKANTCEDYNICNRRIASSDLLQRQLINLITKISGTDVFDDNNKNGDSNDNTHLTAICWWLNDFDDKIEEYSGDDENQVLSTALIQRYLLAVLYHSTGGDKWYKKDNWLSNTSECNWYGVSCETHPNIVSSINLQQNKLRGSLPSELGELTGLEHLKLDTNHLINEVPIEVVKLSNLQTLSLSNNRLKGAIYSEIEYLKLLQDLDLSDNRFSSTLPSEIGSLSVLKSLYLDNNAFSGELPEQLRNLTSLMVISLHHNLFNGNVLMLDNLTTLEYLDLSNNYFTGSIPLAFGRIYKKLRIAYLNNNEFSGNIPSIIEEFTSLDELILYQNELTGSLPSQIGKLINVSKISLSYNNLKGTISKELSNLNTLNLLHLHNNNLEGSADLFNYTIKSFITDCGRTEISPGLVECLNCSECCNVDGNCLTKAKTWPKETLATSQFTPAVMVILLSLVASLLLFIILLIVSYYKNELKLPYLPFSVWDKFQTCSVYKFYLSTNVLAWFIASLSVLLQGWIVVIFLQSGDKTFLGNLWLYSVRCSDESLECKDQSMTDATGWVMFGTILGVFLIPDILDGLFIIYECTLKFNVRGIVAGIVVLNITILSIVASYFHLHATSISNIAIIKDAVIVLFLNSIDEQFYLIIKRVVPGWLDKLESEILSWLYTNARTVEISEIIDEETYQEMTKMGLSNNNGAGGYDHINNRDFLNDTDCSSNKNNNMKAVTPQSSLNGITGKDIEENEMEQDEAYYFDEHISTAHELYEEFNIMHTVQQEKFDEIKNKHLADKVEIDRIYCGKCDELLRMQESDKKRMQEQTDKKLEEILEKYKKDISEILKSQKDCKVTATTTSSDAYSPLQKFK